MQDMQEKRDAWVVVGACFVSLAVIFGVAYSFAALFEPLSKEFSAHRADVSAVFGLSGLIYFTLGIGGGMLSDRWGPRLVCGSGMCVMAAGLLATSWATSLSMVYLSYGACVGLGIALVYTPSIGSVQPWFGARRGLAAGIASAGIGAGTLLVPLLMGWSMLHLDWREALRWLALAVLLIGGGATTLLRTAPSVEASRRSGASVEVAGLSLRAVLKSPLFWWLYASVVLAAPTMFIPFAHVSASARDLGMSESGAVGLVGVIGVGSLMGRFAIGALADRLGRRPTLLIMQMSMGLTYLVWLNAAGDHALMFFALWFGLSYGGIVSLLPAICMDLFGARAVSGVIGALYSGAGIGNLLGPVMAGAVFDRTGNYLMVMWGCMALSALAVLATVKLLGDKHTRY